MNIAVFGATGQVGVVMRSILAERNFPYDEIRFFASPRSAGSRLLFAGREIEVENSYEASFEGIDIALFSNGATASRELAPKVAAAGAIVVDNSSAWRMNPEVPLVVPEVNAEELEEIPLGIVANPNCTTMVCMTPLAALRDRYGLLRVVASTYQAVSGAGVKGVRELQDQLSRGGGRLSELTFDGTAVDLGTPEAFVAPIAANVIPLAGSLVGDETNEEHKFRDESRKILGLPGLRVAATCVRVPVFTGHSVNLNVELESPFDITELRQVIASAPAVVMAEVPTPLMAAGQDPSYVGRVRRDDSVENGVALFVAGDNLRKGAALNTIQIAEALVERGVVTA
ncbi:MAG: aspartate-semialdehyde dehydrogenase [Nitrospiraceae bacterium]|nr:aspartate-semialdehyde dehydrogenase [Nitrospiraceae bacterium]